jgi:SAM-dependent methyltransferase
VHPDQPLPFENESFDLVVTDMVVEHVEKPQEVSTELLRVLRPGGFLCVRTPNKWSYVALAATLVPNRLHSKALEAVQPNRLEKDIFPTFYRMNSASSLRKLFKGNDVYITKYFADPAYYFDSKLVFGFFRLLHWILPRPFAPVIFAFIRKAGG